MPDLPVASQSMARAKVPVPVFSDNYEQYSNKVKIWQKVCGLPKNQQALVLWLNLPDNHSSNIKEKIFNEIEVEMETDEGVKKFIEVMDKAFKPSKQNEIYQIFLDFMIQMKKKDEEDMREFITRFDKLSNVASKHGITLSNSVLGLKIIHDSSISDTDKKLVMTEINFNKPDEIYTNAKGGLNKYLTTVRTKDATGQSPGIKLESNEEEILAAYLWNNKKNKGFLQKKTDSGQEKKRPLNPKGP